MVAAWTVAPAPKDSALRARPRPRASNPRPPRTAAPDRGTASSRAVTVSSDRRKHRAVRHSPNEEPAGARVAGLGDRAPALRLAGAVLAGHEAEVGFELMGVAEAVGIVNGGAEGGGGDGADAGDGAQAQHARILDGEVLDRGVGVRELSVERVLFFEEQRDHREQAARQ